MSLNNKAAELLDNAAQVLLEVGWGQGAYCDEQEDKYCMLGALHEANAVMLDLGLLPRIEAGELTTYRQARHGIRLYLGGASPMDWNDKPGRTVAEVVEVLRNTAALLRDDGVSAT